jgi:hypothetical protein
MLQKIEVLYRDAANYKAIARMTVETETPFQLDEEFEMESIGLNPYQFVPEIMGFAWNEDDHNILTVVDILFAGAETQYHVIRQYQKA